MREALEERDGELRRGRRFEPKRVRDAFAPVLESVLDVLTRVEVKRLRKCAKCELHFHDTSKKGTRRWCSMQMCGNRAKVAAYARRRREGET